MKVSVLLAVIIAALVAGSSVLAAQDSPTDEARKKDVEKLQGTWTFKSRVSDGNQMTPEQLKGYVIIFKGNKVTVKQGNTVIEAGTQKLYPGKKPKEVDYTITEGSGQGEVMPGIYELKGNTLKVCFATPGKDRPTEFKAPAGSGYFVNVYERKKP